MPPTTAPTYTYCNEADVNEFLSVEGKVGRVDDDSDQAVNAAEQLAITQAIRFATMRVNWFAQDRYCPVDLAQSWVVNRWAVICACYWLSCRRGNPPPGSFDELYREAIKDMELVHSGEYQIPDIGLRYDSFPAWSNVRVNVLYALRKIRVQRPISDRTATPYRRNLDHGANFIVEP